MDRLDRRLRLALLSDSFWVLGIQSLVTFSSNHVASPTVARKLTHHHGGEHVHKVEVREEKRGKGFSPLPNPVLDPKDKYENSDSLGMG